MKDFFGKVDGKVIKSFYDGESAYEYLRGINEENSFHILMTDITMPGMDGISLIKKWREIERKKNL